MTALDNQGRTVFESFSRPSAPNARLVSEASMLSQQRSLPSDNTLRQGDVAMSSFILDNALSGKRSTHAESNYVLKNDQGDIAGLDFGMAPNIYKSSFESTMSRNAREQADQVINRALLG